MNARWRPLGESRNVPIGDLSGGAIWKRRLFSTGGTSRKWTQERAASAKIAQAAISQAKIDFLGAAGVTGRAAAGAAAGSAFGLRNVMRASPMAWRRCLGSLFKQRSISRRMAGGVEAGRRFRLGSSLIAEAMISAALSPVNKGSPASISKNTTPKAQMSARRSADLPLACSGDM